MDYNAKHYGTDPIMDGNYFGIKQDSIFVNQNGYTFDYTHNYHLQHPDVWIGIDGTEVGIYGGIFPWKEGAVPGNPHIRRNSTASKTDNDGMLQLDIEVVGQ